MLKRQSDKNPHIAFGSRKFFNAQHHLQKNGFTNHAEWLQMWRHARNSQFFVLGSKDESAGCQSCVMTHLGADQFAVRLRLNGSDRRYVSFKVRFQYGAEHLIVALKLRQAISYRFKRDEKGWRVFASTKALETSKTSDLFAGYVGVDLNVDHVAISETDRFGNAINRWRIALITYGLSRNQAKTATDEVVKQIMAISRSSRKPISIERLNFATKKAQLSYASPKKQRMLSSFAYSRFAHCIRARAHDAGIEVREVNPAYSSKIGKQKYSRRYGLSVHLAAAFVLARRAQKFSDRYVSSDRHHSRVTCKDGARYVSINAKETRDVKRAGLGARDRSARADPPRQRRGVTNPVVVGGIPACESSATRVRLASVDVG